MTARTKKLGSRRLSAPDVLPNLPLNISRSVPSVSLAVMRGVLSVALAVGTVPACLAASDASEVATRSGGQGQTSTPASKEKAHLAARQPTTPSAITAVSKPGGLRPKPSAALPEPQAVSTAREVPADPVSDILSEVPIEPTRLSRQASASPDRPGERVGTRLPAAALALPPAQPSPRKSIGADERTGKTVRRGSEPAPAQPSKEAKVRSAGHTGKTPGGPVPDHGARASQAALGQKAQRGRPSAGPVQRSPAPRGGKASKGTKPGPASGVSGVRKPLPAPAAKANTRASEGPRAKRAGSKPHAPLR